MTKKIILFLIALFVVSAVVVDAQNVDPSTVDVNDLSDDQIMQIITQMEKQGLSENEAINMARLKGMSNSQISLLQKRIKEVQQSGGVANYNQANSSTDLKEGEFSELSSKSVIDSSMVDDKIFGFSFFNNTNLTFEPSVNIPVSDSYVLGAGDEIIIDVWGTSQQSYQLEINTSGEISIPLVGPVYVAGKTLKASKELIKNKLATIYSDLASANPRTFASIHMGEIKAIKINVLGEVLAPGTYTLPGTASLFNVLYLSGGPNKQGSFRDIQLIRNGKRIASLDVYDYLINGNSQVNVPLMDNDVVMVPTFIHRVRVAGEFKRNGIFEAAETETAADMLKYAGGYTEKAYIDKIKLYRNNGRGKTFKEINESNLSQITLANGDSLYVGKVLDRFDNIVSIEGAVFSPGDFEYEQGLTMMGLIQKADGLLENAYLNRGLITRLKADYSLENISFSVAEVINGKKDIALQANDQILIRSIDDMQEEKTISIWGEVQRMGVYPYAENLTIEDMVLKAGGFNERASESTIEVRRRLDYDQSDKSSDVSSELFYFKVSRDLKLDEKASSFILKPYDAIAVRFMPGSQSSGSVTILGEIMYGGIYNLISDNDKISDIIKRAGGLKKNAYPEGATLVRRISLTDEEKAKRKELMEKDSTLIFSELDFATVSVDLDKIVAEPGCKDDIFMRGGDEIRIPSVLQTVKISGEVLNPSSTVFEHKFNVKQYIHASGGFSLNAKKRKTYVLRPNGASYATRGFIFFRNYPKVTPGSEIIVPTKPDRSMPATAWVSLGSAVASLAVVISNIDF
jgi:protein involved in polysaccharide export with SLBB domain